MAYYNDIFGLFMSNLNTTTLLNSYHIYLIILSGLIASVGFFDFTLFIYMSDIFEQTFFMDWLDGWKYYAKIMILFLAGYIGMPLGGFFIGRYGDIHGRKLALSISLIGIGIFTLIASIIPLTKQLDIIIPILFGLVRFGQGIALGGLIPTIWVFVSEHLPTKHLGVGCGLIMAGSLLGVLLAFLFATNLENTLTHDQITLFGWRLPLLIGGSLTCFLLILVRNLPETPIFKQIHTPNYQKPKHPISSINLDDPTQQEMELLLNRYPLERTNNTSLSLLYSITKKYTTYFLPALILSWQIFSLFIIIAILLPQLVNIGFVVKEYYLHIGGIISIFFMILGSLFYGFLTDRFNVGKVIIMGSIFLLLQVMLFFGHLKSGGEFILVFFALLGFASGVIASSPVVIVRIFPAKIRLYGVALTINTAFALMGGLLPFFLNYATFSWRLTPALYLTFVILVTIFISFHVYYLPNTETDMQR